jgi:hypothetical protein
MKRVAWCFVALLCLGTTRVQAQAQAAIAAQCVPVPVSNELSISTTRSLQRNETLLVAVAGNARSLSDLGVQLGTLPATQAITGLRGFQPGMSLHFFQRRISSTVASGSTLRLRWRQADDLSSLCIVAAALPATDFTPVLAYANFAQQTDSNASLDLNLPPWRGQVYWALVSQTMLTAGDLGAIDSVCAGFCLSLREADVAATPASINASFGFSQNLATYLILLADPRLFADGFE